MPRTGLLEGEDAHNLLRFEREGVYLTFGLSE